MNVGWNFRREHLRLQQRSHYVITDGGDQPNVVPSSASVWYYFRETDYAHIRELREIGDTMAQGAAMMTDTDRHARACWARRGRRTSTRPVAEAMYENIKAVGLPKWGEADQTLAKALQRELKRPEIGLATEIAAARAARCRRSEKHGRRVGRHRRRLVERPDGDAALSRRTSPTCPGHNWANAIAMATPIAHKGVTAGAKVAGDDDGRSADAAGARRAGVGLLPQRADEGRRSTRRSSRAERQAGDLAEHGDHGEVPAGDAEVLLRPDASTRPTSSSSGSSTRRCGDPATRG